MTRNNAKHAPKAQRKGALSGQARTVLVLVFLFAAAFVAVIGMKIVQERRDAVYEADLRQANVAALVAERVLSRLAEIEGAARGAADTLAENASDEDAARMLASLVASGDVTDAALLNSASELALATSTDAGVSLFEAASGHDGLGFWMPGTEADAAGAPLLLAVDLPASRRFETLIAQINVEQISPRAPSDQTIVLTDANGRALAGASSFAANADVASVLGADSARARELVAEGAFALAAGPGRDGVERTLGVAPVANSPLAVYVAGPRAIDESGWRRTLVFYVLLLAAPILVTVGLCAVLLMQVENIRAAREQIHDSEKRLNIAIEAARCGVWEWDTTNDTVFITPSLAQLFGRKDFGLISGTEFLALIRREDQEQVRLAIRSAQDAGEVDVEFRATGLPVWLHARGKPWFGADGQPTGRIGGVAIDITEQKGAQSRVAAAETRMRQALESMGESFALWDPRRRLVLSNSKFRDFFHLDEKLVKHGVAYEMLELAAEGAIKEIHDGAEPDTSEMELSDGRWIRMSEREMQDGGLVSIGTDITALKRQERELLDSDAQLRQMVADLNIARERSDKLASRLAEEKLRAEEASESKTKFLRSMSHELRTPLNAINGFSDIMLQEMFGPLGDPHYMEYAKDINDSGQHLLLLINDILDMSKVEAGKLSLVMETVYPDEVAEQCARLMRERARDSDIDLVISVSDLPRIEADARALKQVIINLLTNALKFTRPGGRVELRAQALDNCVRFQVEDNGIGIAPEDVDRLGQPFVQIGDLERKDHEGSGLGLALSKSFVEMHGGELILTSELGKGTTVTFTMPFNQPTDRSSTDDDDGGESFGRGTHGDDDADSEDVDDEEVDADATEPRRTPALT